MTLTINLPFLPPKACSPNWRGHWSGKAQAVKRFRQDCCAWMVSQRNTLSGFTPFRECSIDITFHVRDQRYVMDDDNARATLKAAQDALIDAGIVEGTSDRGIRIRSIAFIPWSELAPSIVLEIHP